MELTRALQLPPGLREQRESVGQRLHQAPERRVRHHQQLPPLTLCEEGLKDCTGSLTREGALLSYTIHSISKTKASGLYLSIKEVVVEHVVVTELILAVELSVSETL